MYYIDIHTHIPVKNDEVISILNYIPEKKTPVISDKSDCQISDNQLFSFGLHPWHINCQSDIFLLDKITDDDSMVAIGECGFDKNATVPFSVQKEVFLRHANISQQSHKPLIIHCVGYFNEIIDLKKLLKPTEKWIIHGFTGHPQLAKQLVGAGFMLSFGNALFNDKSKAVATFIQIPENSFFLETDESAKSIDEIYQQASQLKNKTISVLKELIYNNFINTFKLKDGMVKPN